MQEYLAVDSSPQAVLVAGWSEPGFMAELLQAFDTGSSCLPPGSEIVFVNNHPPDTTLGALLRGKTLSNVKVCSAEVWMGKPCMCLVPGLQHTLMCLRLLSLMPDKSMRKPVACSLFQPSMLLVGSGLKVGIIPFMLCVGVTCPS